MAAREKATATALENLTLVAKQQAALETRQAELTTKQATVEATLKQIEGSLQQSETKLSQALDLEKRIDDVSLERTRRLIQLTTSPDFKASVLEQVGKVESDLSSTLRRLVACETQLKAVAADVNDVAVMFGVRPGESGVIKKPFVGDGSPGSVLGPRP